jgi:hypothetical protein
MSLLEDAWVEIPGHSFRDQVRCGLNVLVAPQEPGGVSPKCGGEFVRHGLADSVAVALLHQLVIDSPETLKMREMSFVLCLVDRAPKGLGDGSGKQGDEVQILLREWALPVFAVDDE